MCQVSFRAALLVLLVSAPPALAQTITPPERQFGHAIGADYVLPNYSQFAAYWEKLADESDRMVLDTIGTTAEGRPQIMAIITAPGNHARLDHFRGIARRLALADNLDEDEARRLAAEGRAVVWIDGGLHATEVLGAQQLMETVYQLLSRDDAETRRILDDVIILAVHANPDGMELVSDWYMRESEPTRRSTSGIPRLYQKYVGHDNNRDFYASTQPETENMNRVMYTEWFPQIVYNHHQTGPAGTVMFAPPFRDPFNHNYDPLIPVSVDMVGAAMHDRFLREGKPGVTMRSGANYSTWWNGGLRTTPYFHNMIGLLTETIGNPTPMEIPFIARRQLPHGDLPAPIEPQAWHFRQSVDYSVTANYAVLDIASRRRDVLLYNIYRMGRNSIDRGRRDSWTQYPRHIARAAEQIGTGAQGSGTGPDAGRGTRKQFEELLRDPALRDARGYILPADQPDFLTAAKFVDALLETGVQVHRATGHFTVNGRTYPGGSFVVLAAQAFRPHVIDMFEPQDHPDDIPYPGGPPTPPYDNAGWTLAYQMGVEFDRILDEFSGPFQRIEGLRAPRPAGGIRGSGNAGWMLSPSVNDAFVAVNRLLAAGHDVYRLDAAVTMRGESHPRGTFFIRQGTGVRAAIESIAAETGLTFTAAGSRPGGQHTKLRPIRVALWDRYGGSMPSGWTRWIFEQFDFPFEVVYPRTLDEGDLRSRFDAVVLVTGAVPPAEAEEGGRRGAGAFGTEERDVPAEFAHMSGSITPERTVPRLREFLEAGGTVITIGTSTSLARHLGLPVENALTEVVDGRERPLPRSKYYVPGSILQVRVDTTLAIAAGMARHVDVMFDNSPVFRIPRDAQNLRPIAWFDSPEPLRSGWAWGESALENGVTMAEADVGSGRLFLFGPEVLFRAQPHGTFRFVFNGLYASAGERTAIR